jgi:hypothetical protein
LLERLELVHLGERNSSTPWASKKTKKKLVLGVDISLEDSVSMALCSLVGRLSYRHLCTTDLDDWMKKLGGHFWDMSPLSHILGVVGSTFSLNHLRIQQLSWSVSGLWITTASC